MLVAEAQTQSLDLKRWQETVHQRSRVFLTDAKSVYDYVNLEGGSHSRDRRMTIEGALLREGMRQPLTVLKWVDGSQNLADVLTKADPSMDYMREFLRSCLITWTQHAAAVRVKEQKRKQRSTRKEQQKPDQEARHAERRRDAAQRLAAQELPEEDDA